MNERVCSVGFFILNLSFPFLRQDSLGSSFTMHKKSNSLWGNCRGESRLVTGKSMGILLCFRPFPLRVLSSSAVPSSIQSGTFTFCRQKCRVCVLFLSVGPVVSFLFPISRRNPTHVAAAQRFFLFVRRCFPSSHSLAAHLYLSRFFHTLQ